MNARDDSIAALAIAISAFAAIGLFWAIVLLLALSNNAPVLSSHIMSTPSVDTFGSAKDWINIAAIVIGPIVSVVVSSLLYLRFEEKKTKKDAARRLIANRHDITGDEFTRALNEVYVVFSESPRVIESLKKFHDAVVAKHNELITPRLMELFKEVMKSAGIDPSKVGDSFFSTPFNVKTKA